MKTSRRSFIKLSGCLTVGFVIGNPGEFFSSEYFTKLPESLKRNPAINAWLEILPTGNVRVYTGKMELGQGVRTAIAQVAADELELDIKKIEIVLADTARTPDEGYTAGSGSMEQSAMAVRHASAAAKERLLELAAKKLNKPATELTFDNGLVYTKDKKRSLNFAQIIDGRQITEHVTPAVVLKAKGKYNWVGKPIKRDDIGLMVEGREIFVQDLRFDNMVHARVVRPPAYAAKLISLDEDYLGKELKNALKIVRNGNFLGVIAKDEYSAVEAQKKLKWAAKWSETSLKPGSETDLKKYIESLPVKSEQVLAKGSNDIKEYAYHAHYYKPYIMHGSIGPSCAIAYYHQNKLQIWTHSQGVFPLRKALAAMLQMKEDDVHVTGVPGAGCYGHNGADDVAADAAVFALAYPGRHVRLQWMREDEHLWEPYGSAMILNAYANVGSGGKISAWKYEVRSDNHSTRPGGNAANLLPARYISQAFEPPSGGYSGGAYRNSQLYYSVPNEQVHAHLFNGPLRVSALRSLGAYANIFAIESFMDELAEKARKDPFDFRLAHQDDPRATEVIRKLRDMLAGEKTGQGEGIGIAFSRYKNSAAYCAAAAKMLVDKDKKVIAVLKMWAVIDAGEVINLDGIINQTESGLVQSASWTLMEEVKFDNRHITSGDWGSYPIMRFSDVPEVEVDVIVRPDEEVLGAGEAAQGPAAAAIANAVYRACGKRIRELPITREKLFGIE